ncbi:hypothetical protein PPACK8108_LOCUS14334 [Phakopsora pachyrhizi]|uniref:Uncharacterized protein n=1 Tax=Phakopsora pachyrhizi TaxID=170000 RepID=A0AAV0B808_PHAPC|nr:hypothetical protein PPACK8108_LOCUS14334 [Phakopsora pachyrhizi]
MKGFFITLLPSQSTIEVTFLQCVTKNKPGGLIFQCSGADSRLIGSNNRPSMTTPVLEESKTRSFEAVSGLSSFNILLVESSKFTDTGNKLPRNAPEFNSAPVPELPLQSCPVRDHFEGTNEVRADMECETGVVGGIKNLEASTDVAEKWCKARGFGIFQEG